MKIFFPNDNGTPFFNALDNLKLKKAESIKLEGFAVESGIAFQGCIVRQPASAVEGSIYEITDAQLWDFDKVFSPAIFYKDEIKELPDETYGLFLNSGELNFALSYNDNKQNSINNCDLLLMIPGFFKKSIPTSKKHFTGNMLNINIKKIADSEFAGEYIKDNTRITIGTILLASCECAYDESGCETTACTSAGKIKYQPAIVNLLIHNQTKLCVVEIYVPNVNLAVQRILANCCGNNIKVVYEKDKIISLKDYLDFLGITLYGGKRSMVFVQEEISEENLLNLLVNEEVPMGKIMGKRFKEIIANNLAQYDTARVYASETTMVEIVKDPLPDIKARIEAQAIEIFFVEMLLLQDAAVSKMNQAVKENVVAERKNPYSKSTKDTIDELALEMSHVIDFTDYSQFYFPTVRVSAEKVAEAFGIKSITNKFEENKALLQQMINSHSKKVDEKENQVKNVLLFIISFFSGIGVVSEFLNNIFGGAVEKFSFYIAIGLMTVGVLIYQVARKIVRFSLKRKHKRNNQAGNNGKQTKN